MAGRLDGRIALVTGASRGIGAAVAVRFAEASAPLFPTGRAGGGPAGNGGLLQADGGRGPPPTLGCLAVRAT